MHICSPRPFRFFLLLLFLSPLCYFAQQSAVLPQPQPFDPLASRQWADSVLNRLGLEEKIGQLFMVAAYSNRDQQHVNEIRYLVQEYGLGGLIMMQGDPVSQVNLVNAYQAIAPVPLLISQDAEWGLGMRLDQTMRFPYNMTLGAIRDDSLLYQLGREYAWQLRHVGVHVNFAPVVDINNNPANPVINYRSFGENKYKVARKGIMLSKGMQDYGVLACAKHFPGHGDTDSDSHFGLPLIAHDKTRLDTLELYPFVKLAQAGIASFMVAHLSIPALDETPNRASTLSPLIVEGLLRQGMAYEGLVFTDALNMQGVTKYYKPGEVDLAALLAGNDVLLFSEDVPTAVKAIQGAITDGQLSLAELDQHVRRILMAKHRVGLNRPAPVSNQQLDQNLHTTEGLMLRRKLYEAAITLVKNEEQLLPLRRLENRKIAYLQIGGKGENEFANTLARYGDVSRFYLASGFDAADRARMMRQLAGYNTVIVGIMGMRQQPSRKYGITQEMQALLDDLDKEPVETVLTLFGNPYSLRYVGKESAILVAYEDVPDAMRAAAMAIFGGIKVEGELPVTASADFPEGTGIRISKPKKDWTAAYWWVSIRLPITTFTAWLCPAVPFSS
jgi:beta-N-acetylhexosaminidase